jgi:hypothetical protein
MKKLPTQWITALLLWFALPMFAMAVPVTIYNDNLTAIFGSGNPNTGFTTNKETDTGLSISLRAKDRVDGDTTNVNGVYSSTYISGTRWPFNYELSFNGGGQAVNNYNVWLQVDNDTSQGVSFTTVNALTYWNDNSFGMPSTANGSGFEGPAAILGGTNQIMQLSQNPAFGDYPAGGIAPFANATFDFRAYVTAANEDMFGTRLVDVGIQAVVGAGGAPAQGVPDGGSTAALIAVGLCGMASLRRAFFRN